MIHWLKSNWLVVLLIGIIVFLGQNTLFGATLLSSRTASIGGSYEASGIALAPQSDINLKYSRDVAPVESTTRLVIQDTNLSLVVKDVSASIKQIESTASSLGGYLVNSYLSKPEGAASGNIVVRVPEAKRSEALDSFKNLAVKVVSESVSGNDVTDEYVDLDSRLAVLLTTKKKFEEILDKAFTVNDLLNVQRELINLQSQIDSLKGQQKYYEQSAKLNKVTVYLSTDELALPYAPTTEWRPTVVFKTAVRSLLTTVRSLGNLVIWLAVYSVIFIPLLIIFLFLRRRFFRRLSNPQHS